MIRENLIKIMEQLLLMFCTLKKKKYIYASKHNLNHEKQVILLIISNGDK